MPQFRVSLKALHAARDKHLFLANHFIRNNMDPYKEFEVIPDGHYEIYKQAKVGEDQVPSTESQESAQ